MNKKIIFLDFEEGLGKNYREWTREAVQDFINLFPEYKDNFEVKDGNVGYHDIGTLDAIVAQNKEIYNQRGQFFDEAEFLDQFKVTEPGKCHASLSKQVALASKDGVLDIQKLNKLQADSVGNTYNRTSPVIIGVSKQPAAGNIRGISSEIGVNISAGTCERLGLSREVLKAYFKDIVIHELGHTFGAANENQRNTVENLGSHCKDPNCLMYEYSYTGDSFNRRHRQKKESPFCSDCMESMRYHMEHDLKFERKGQEAVEVENTPEPLPEKADKDRKFKKDLRTVFKTAAEKEGSKYKENIQKQNYFAEITHKDGSVDRIQASSASRISLSAKDKDGKEKTPDMERFKNLAEYAHNQGKKISFGNIKTPEFKARLMIACMEHKPPVEMKNAPEINDDFLNSLEPKTRQKLQQQGKENNLSLMTAKGKER